MKYGEKVYWKNDPAGRPWFVLRVPKDSQFVYITESIKMYPKVDAHAVPIGTLSDTPFVVVEAAPSLAEEAPPALTPHPTSSSVTAAPRRPVTLYPDRYLPPAPAAPIKTKKPAIKVPGGLDLNGLKAYAASVGLGPHHMERIHEIWEAPAPNKPMRTMRIHNYIKNEYQKVETEMEVVE